jgi:glucose/arabinose dehydrogenase
LNVISCDNDRLRISYDAVPLKRFIAESGAGRIRVARSALSSIFASSLRLPFGIAFYPSGNEPHWIYVANTDSIVRFRYHNGARRHVPRLARCIE